MRTWLAFPRPDVANHEHQNLPARQSELRTDSFARSSNARVERVKVDPQVDDMDAVGIHVLLPEHVCHVSADCEVLIKAAVEPSVHKPNRPAGVAHRIHYTRDAGQARGGKPSVVPDSGRVVQMQEVDPETQQLTMPTDHCGSEL